MRHIYTGIDIGSDTVKIAVCELNKNKLNLLAASSVKSKGIKRGLIVNVDEASDSLQKAINEGVPFIGYSLWTYCDIFSPSGGYRKKYGLVGVDFENKTLDRFPKSSMYWYKDVINNLRAFDKDELNYNKYYNEALKSFKTNKIWNKNN